MACALLALLLASACLSVALGQVASPQAAPGSVAAYQQALNGNNETIQQALADAAQQGNFTNFSLAVESVAINPAQKQALTLAALSDVPFFSALLAQLVAEAGPYDFEGMGGPWYIGIFANALSESGVSTELFAKDLYNIGGCSALFIPFSQAYKIQDEIGFNLIPPNSNYAVPMLKAFGQSPTFDLCFGVSSQGVAPSPDTYLGEEVFEALSSEPAPSGNLAGRKLK